MNASLSGQVLLPTGLEPAELNFGELITGVTRTGNAAADRYILPGFIDVHVHGGGGGDTMDGAEGVRQLARFHAGHGTTTILPTTITNPTERIMAALLGVREVALERRHDLPDIPGAHLEGPFISRNRLGAQPDFVLEPSDPFLQQVLDLDVVRVATIAPELPGAIAAAQAFNAAGVRVSLGHSTDDGTFASAVLQALPTAGFTHLFNAMGGIEGRRPGLAGTALASSTAYAELVYDLQHVHPDVMKLTLNARPEHLLFVTDAMRASGLGDGPTELGGQPVTVEGGRALLGDGTLAGSILTMDQALRNALASGVSWTQAASLTSGAAARYLGLDDRAEIAAGKRADLVVLNSDLQVEEVWVLGRRLA